MEEQKSYEFDESQNQVIGELAKKMNFVGLILVILAVLSFVGGIFTIVKGGFGNIINGVLYLIIGIWTMKAAKAFKLIVDTAGNDIKNLMEAIAELKNLYTLQFWLIILLIIIFVVAMIIGIIGGAAYMMRPH